MSKPTAEPSPERILVALDALSQGRAAIEAAAALAAGLRAELRGLFVKNVDLLKLAALPFAAEIGYASPLFRQLDRESLERTLQAQAEQLGRALAEAADRVQVQWSFEVARGQILEAALAAAAECNLLILGLEGRAPKLAPGLGAAGASRAKGPTLVAFDETASSAAALETAARLAAEDGHGLIILAVSPDADRARELRRQASDLLREMHVEGAPYDRPITGAASAVQAARQLHGKALVVSRNCTLLADKGLEILANELDCPLIIVKQEASSI